MKSIQHTVSANYLGLPETARLYCQSYLRWAIGFALLVLFTGALGALMVVEFFPQAIWFYVLAAVSFVIHGAALVTNDIWQGDYEPSQTTYGTMKVVLVIIVLLGVYISAVISFGALVGYGLTLIDAPIVVAAIAAAYYPVIDIMLERQGVPTPGRIVKLCSVVGVGTIVDFHKSAVEALPVFGKRGRPQS